MFGVSIPASRDACPRPRGGRGCIRVPAGEGKGGGDRFQRPLAGARMRLPTTARRNRARAERMGSPGRPSRRIRTRPRPAASQGPRTTPRSGQPARSPARAAPGTVRGRTAPSGGVCRGSGSVPRRRRAASPGRVAAPRASVASNHCGMRRRPVRPDRLRGEAGRRADRAGPSDRRRCSGRSVKSRCVSVVHPRPCCVPPRPRCAPSYAPAVRPSPLCAPCRSCGMGGG